MIENHEIDRLLDLVASELEARAESILSQTGCYEEFDVGGGAKGATMAAEELEGFAKLLRARSLESVENGIEEMRVRPRGLNGRINNCALACGQPISSCQMCMGDCPDATMLVVK